MTYIIITIVTTNAPQKLTIFYFYAQHQKKQMNIRFLDKFVRDSPHVNIIDPWIQQLLDRKTCTSCGAVYTDVHSLGMLECKQHIGSYIAATDRWSCCGVSGTSEYKCVRCDHNDANQPFDVNSCFRIRMVDYEKLPVDMVMRIKARAKIYGHEEMIGQFWVVHRVDVHSAKLRLSELQNFFSYTRAQEFTERGGYITYPGHVTAVHHDDYEFMTMYGNEMLAQHRIEHLRRIWQ